MKIAVLGSNAEGRAIAQACTMSGYEVTLHAGEATDAMDTIDVIERQLDDAVDAGSLSEAEFIEARDSLEGTTTIETAVSEAEVVIETERTDVGEIQRRFAELEEFLPRESLVTTSQPLVSVTAAAAGLRHPDRALGLHFHRPLEGGLVEVVVTDQTAGTVIERAESFVTGLDARTALVRDTPGLASARLALALEVEAMRLVADGVAGVEAIDAVLTRGYEHAVGPLEQADRAGLDERIDVLSYLAETLGDRFEPPELLANLVDDGNTGMDAGEGFYVWENGEPVEGSIAPPELGRGEGLPDDPSRS